MTDPAPYSVPKEPGRWRAITLAVIVHIALLAFLWIGIRWQNETPVGVEAEIWSPQNHEAAARPEPPVQHKQPEPAPEPKPVVKETPPPPQPPVAEPVRENPDIALEREKERKVQEKRLREEQEKQAKLKQQKLEQEREQKQAQAEKERIERQKEKEKAEALAKKEKEAEQAKKLAADKLAADKKRQQDALDAAAAQKRRDDDMKRLMAQAGTGGSGAAATTQGSRADSDYGNKVGAKIRSNTIFNVSEGLSGNPAAEFEVELLPDGSIRSLRKTKSSGLPGFDDAVQRAIGKSAPFPPNKDGKVPSSFKLVHHAKDQ
ncbi:MAG TPA: cell envelope integrity protein TolA [Burkholderiaceae bacterium]|nr:cell envelope integrity protein TolA [Burkholderiaceae bacterium]